jgi:multimeric flavodoxin WrbA
MESMQATPENSTSDRTPGLKILGVSGSPRKKGNSDILLQQMLSGAARENLSATDLYLRDIQFQGCIGCEKCRKDKICTGIKDGMSSLYPDIISSKGLILVSPTHNYNVTSWMKAFIDRLYCFYNFEEGHPRCWSSQLSGQNRKAIVAAICEQESKADMGFTIEAMKLPLEALGYEIVGEMAVLQIFDRGKVREDAEAMDQAVEMGSRLARAVAR